MTLFGASTGWPNVCFVEFKKANNEYNDSLLFAHWRHLLNLVSTSAIRTEPQFKLQSANDCKWHKTELHKSEEGYSPKRTVIGSDAKGHASLPPMDGFTACLRELYPFRCSLTSQRTLSSNCQHHVALPLCSECNLQQTQPLRQPHYSLGFLNFSTIWFTSPMARCLAFSSSVPAIVGGKDQMPDG